MSHECPWACPKFLLALPTRAAAACSTAHRASACDCSQHNERSRRTARALGAAGTAVEPDPSWEGSDQSAPIRRLPGAGPSLPTLYPVLRRGTPVLAGALGRYERI